MENNNFKIVKLRESCYARLSSGVANQSLYGEIQYQRDRSSFAGMVFDIISDKGVIIVEDREETLIQQINRYEKIYMGCEQDYINCIKRLFSNLQRGYGIKIHFLIYSDIRSSQMIFEELIKNVDENIDKNINLS